MPPRIPPGRSGRLWLLHRLRTADRAAELLEQKRRALEGEQRRLALLAARTEEDWVAAVAEAERWLARALVIAGDAAVDRTVAHVPGPARIRAAWASTMGVVYPANITCEAAGAFPAASVGGTAAMQQTADAYRVALEAAAQHAAARMAAQRVADELASTVRRLRMIERRWAPMLEDLLARLELHLDEQEREDLVASRWAQSSGQRMTSADSGPKARSGKGMP